MRWGENEVLSFVLICLPLKASVTMWIKDRGKLKATLW